MKFIINTLEEMNDLGIKIADSLKGGELIALSGNLGAGKTTLTKSIGKRLEVKEDIISPTFNIVKVYNSKLGPLYHIDAYRLENLGYDPVLDDYLFDDSALKFVEWFNFLDEDLFENAIKIDITVKDGSRIVNIEGDLCLD